MFYLAGRVKRTAQFKMRKERDITKLDLSSTLELYNVDFARKAVGNLFENENLHNDIISNEEVDNTSIRPIMPKAFVEALAEEDLTEGPIEPKLPKSRALKSQYVFIDEEEDDEFSEFRRRYKERDGRSLGPPKKIIDTPPKEKEQPVKQERRKRVETGKETHAATSSVGPLRIAIVGMMIVLLLMMVYLVYRNNDLSNQLEAATARLYGSPDLNYQLGVARGIITNYQRELELLRAIIDDYQMDSSESYYMNYEYSGTYASDGYYAEDYGNYGAYIEEPQPPLPPAPRMHTVVSGDNLSRISTHFYGNASYANIRRIMYANNISDPNDLPVGMRLTIPN